ncbi:hypothetical protein MST27_06280 [Pseudomonas sp. PS1]|uniref:Uncharacterized protein n=1 Tax=Stutzerimonas marianensis TaxID=2929513 RepID=A0A9X1W1L1_9GAMM|nr:hypothetical protein [Pseudomonas marianensis]MCJ0972972.1 hypothetical protein [Pseudomonas marianensis]
MYLIQLLLPLYDNTGQPLPKTLFASVRDELVQRFGGLTAHARAPVDGLWCEDDEHAVRDDLILYEVMTADLDRGWWQQYRTSLEARFRQEQVMIRAQHIEQL